VGAGLRIGVIGLGAIGGPVAARLAAGLRAGEILRLAAGSEATAAKLRASGLSVEFPGEALAVPAARFAAPDLSLDAQLPAQESGYDVLLLCVRSEATQAALAHAAPLLAQSGALVCLQNGLPEEAAAAQAGAARTLGAVIGWSATVDGPGRYRITGKGAFCLGAFAPAGEAQLEKCKTLLSRAFPVKLTRNLAGARWGKLALNCAISTTGAISGLSFGELARSAAARDLALRCIGEVVAVAKASGVKLEPSSGLRAEWLDGLSRPWLNPLRGLLFRLAAAQRPTQRSGMLERLLAGRTSGQIDDLNGAVVRAAERVGVPVPVNRALLGLVHAIERGEARVGPGNLARAAELAAALPPQEQR
jgi:2-dehydropantoate 2-reductase